MNPNTDIINAAYDISLAHDVDNPALATYVNDWRVAVTLAHRVTRIDLYELVNALADYDFFWHPSNDAESLVLSVYNDMDLAAAFASCDTPLVLPADRLLDRFDYSCTPSDDDATRALKLARQTPAVPSYREYVAR